MTVHSCLCIRLLILEFVFPVGPLQHHVAEPDLNAWESIDWAALNLGLDDANQGHANNPGNGGASAEPQGSGVPDDPSYAFGSGYGFTWPTTQHPYAHWMNGSHYHHEH